MIIDFSKLKPKDFVALPPSKSLANRLLIIAAMARQKLPAVMRGEADDTQLLRQLLSAHSSVVDAGMAGTAFRFLTAFLAIRPGSYVLTGHERMKLRPIGPLVAALNELGAQISYIEKQGFPPLKIEGEVLQGGKVTIRGDISSQYISALLMVAPAMKKGLELTVLRPFYSEPYVEMTVNLMGRCGIQVERINDTYLIKNQEYKAIDFVVEPDWSAASYWYELVALGGAAQIELPGLNKDSLQGDAVCADLFEDLGVVTDFTESGILLRKSSRSISEMALFDCSDCPDLVQTLACTCAGLGVKGQFFGIKSLRIKETDRVAALISELAKLGVVCSAGEDHLEIISFSDPKSTDIETFNDHRMAMAFAPLALKFGPLEIQNPEVVSKSYSGYWQDLGIEESKIVIN
jgi:3-phosphoshikimate 1-carboxyvinyltransferase